MEYAVDIGSDAMMNIPDFIKTSSGSEKLMGEGMYTDTQTAW
jgi:hypothetical protein